MSGEFVPYDIVYCSSYDPHHPISQLVGYNHESVNFEERTGGWHSARNGKVPQMLVLRFPGNVRLRQLKILSHEAKIASTVEVRVFSLPNSSSFNVAEVPPFRTVRFTKLGAVEFSSNEHSHYKLKERKTVHVKADAYFLKLIFGRPFVNERNTGQQVGIYSIQCTGKVVLPIQIHADVALVSSATKWIEMEWRASATPFNEHRPSFMSRRESECARPNSTQSTSAANHIGPQEKPFNDFNDDNGNINSNTPTHQKEHRPSLTNALANRRRSLERRPSLSISNIGEGLLGQITENDKHNSTPIHSDKHNAQVNRSRSTSPHARDPQWKSPFSENKSGNKGNDDDNDNDNDNDNEKGKKSNATSDLTRAKNDKAKRPQLRTSSQQSKKKEEQIRETNAKGKTESSKLAVPANSASGNNSNRALAENDVRTRRAAELASQLGIAEATKRPAELNIAELQKLQEQASLEQSNKDDSSVETDRESIDKNDLEENVVSKNNDKNDNNSNNNWKKNKHHNNNSSNVAESEEDEEDNYAPVPLAHTRAQMPPIPQPKTLKENEESNMSSDYNTHKTDSNNNNNNNKAITNNKDNNNNSKESKMSKVEPFRKESRKPISNIRTGNVKDNAGNSPKTSGKTTPRARKQQLSKAATTAIPPPPKETKTFPSVSKDEVITQAQQHCMSVTNNSIDHSSDSTVFRSVKIVEFEALFLSLTEQLLIRKEEAVAVEDFETASACRNMLQFLQARAKRIYELEQEKVQAIIEENFVSAEHAKTMMDDLVQEIVHQVQIPPLRYATDNVNEDEIQEGSMFAINNDSLVNAKVKCKNVDGTSRSNNVSPKKYPNSKDNRTVMSKPNICAQDAKTRITGKQEKQQVNIRTESKERVNNRLDQEKKSNNQVRGAVRKTIPQQKSQEQEYEEYEWEEEEELQQEEEQQQEKRASVNFDGGNKQRSNSTQRRQLAANAKKQREMQREPQKVEEIEYEQEEEKEEEEQESNAVKHHSNDEEDNDDDEDEYKEETKQIHSNAAKNESNGKTNEENKQAKVMPRLRQLNKPLSEADKNGKVANTRRSLDNSSNASSNNNKSTSSNSININNNNNNCIENEPVRSRASHTEEATLYVRNLSGRERQLAMSILSMANDDEEKQDNEVKSDFDANNNDNNMNEKMENNSHSKSTPHRQRTGRSPKDVKELSIENIDSLQNTGQLLPTVGKFVTACLMSKKFKLREAALNVLASELTTQFHGESRVAVAEAVLRFLDFSGFGLQDGIPNVVFAACSFVRMILSDETHLPPSLIVPLSMLLSRLLTRAADNVARTRDEALMTLAAYVQTSAIPTINLINAVLAEPTDLDRRTRPVTNPKVQVARLSLLQMLVEQDRISHDSTFGQAILNKLLIPCANHQNQGVRDIACGLLKALTAAKKLVLREADLRRINNSAIRETLEDAKASETASRRATKSTITSNSKNRNEKNKFVK